MKRDTSGIDRAELAALIEAQYGLDVSLAFLPEGEEAYSYIAADQRGERVFVKAHETTGGRALETAFAAATALRTECGLEEVVAPCRNRGGAFTCRLGRFSVAVFPFVEGTHAYRAGISDEELRDAAGLIAAIHTRGTSLSLPRLPEERFDKPFAAPILCALEAAAQPDPPARHRQRQLRGLLTTERADILATLERMECLKVAARGLDIDRVLTHGDPNLANILIDAEGGLHLIDWGDVAFGPPERDLTAFTEDRFELFLRRYTERTGAPVLHEELFAFYLYRWAVQEIADYSTRILFRNTSDEEDERAWSRLTPYLPIPHTEIHAALDEISDVMRSVLGG